MTSPLPAHPMPTHGAWLQTYTGIPFDLFDPKPELVSIEDIAHSLAQQCRFGGHTERFYSVAQHSVACAALLCREGYSVDILLQALLHDAAEAYCVDVPRPLKRELSGYSAIESRVWKAVAAAFNLPEELHPIVKWADNEVLAHEAQLHLAGGPLFDWAKPTTPLPILLKVPMTAGQAEEQFLAYFEHLCVGDKDVCKQWRVYRVEYGSSSTSYWIARSATEAAAAHNALTPNEPEGHVQTRNVQRVDDASSIRFCDDDGKTTQTAQGVLDSGVWTEPHCIGDSEA